MRGYYQRSPPKRGDGGNTGELKKNVVPLALISPRSCIKGQGNSFKTRSPESDSGEGAKKGAIEEKGVYC